MKVRILVATGLVVVIACGLWLARRPAAPALSLVFERYSTGADFLVHDVAFLWFTNASDRAYGLPMTGGTNTFERDTPLGRQLGSVLVNCEFSDGPKPPPVTFASLGLCHVAAPHSAVRVRVPLPPPGRPRRVAVLCAEMPSGTPRVFWTKGIGLSLLRWLPRSMGRRLLFTPPEVLRVWCERELSNPGESPAER